jgi:NarL family two-component system response regulator YdfI
MPDEIRVLIADDHEMVREGLRLILESEAGFLVVGEATNGAEAVRLTEELQPQVVLMDLRMPGMDGLEAIEHLRARWLTVQVVILTTYNEDDLMLRGLRAGALGYLLKDTNRQTLFNTLRAAARGEALLLPEVMARVFSRLTPTPPLPSPPRSEGAPLPLTDREREVLAGVARGERNKEIANHLGITERTVKAHLASIYNKWGVDSRAAAIAIASQQGLL